MSTSAAGILTGANAPFIAELYERYLEDPTTVDPSWADLFQDLKDDGLTLRRDWDGPPWRARDSKVIGAPDPDAAVLKKAKSGKGDFTLAQVREEVLASIRAIMLIRAYRARGHAHADLDPLGLHQPKPEPELEYRNYGFTDADLDRTIMLDNVLGMERATLREIIQALRETYCSTIGVEYVHVQNPEQKDWLQKRIEGIRNRTAFTNLGRRTILERLTAAEGFERFLQMKYVGTKRFGLEGGEALIPALEQILKRGGQLGVREVVLGMAHRGRLNVLTNFMAKPFQAVFSEFQGNPAHPDDVEGSGDVKYHLGTSSDREFDDFNVHLSLTANPSHLEVVNPVVLGKVRAKQRQLNDEERTQVLGLLLHGDAAFAGQGVVPECLMMSQLPGYATGGTIHVIINNQIGFTTAPQFSRSGEYCTDVAMMVQAPIFHVNGDDPEAVVHVARVATEFRQEFHTDLVIDMWCYRRHGHNESDEPAFTQPKMYARIKDHPTTRTLYAEKLVRDGLVAPEYPDELLQAFHDKLEHDFNAAADFKPNKADWLEGAWSGLANMAGEEEFEEGNTAASVDALQRVGKAIFTPPKDVKVNGKIVRQLKAKLEMLKSGEGFDWATAEALALGTLIEEGTPIRLSGQDSGRGTFSQRHAVLTDQETEERYIPLNNLAHGEAVFRVHDSPLSEEAVLGFEYGFSLADPHSLTIWEAQFGDFVNGAQVIIDQFIASAEVKWLRLSGLVMLLPHGYEGQGPEHSSARPERFLQLCAQDNMQVCNLTTPANYFHALRRQIHRNFRKPLIIMTPKSLLRHKRCVSTLADMGPGSRFMRVIPETEKLVAEDKVRRVVLCSGKVYYDLLEAREAQGIKDVAIVRVEQLYPWPKITIKNQLARYPNADVVWCQEEPANQGSWTFVDRRLAFILDELNGGRQGRPLYAGRAAAAAPATGLLKAHHLGQELLVNQALNGTVEQLREVEPFHRVTKMGR